MRDRDQQTRIIKKLETVWEEFHPDWRFGQLMFNLTREYDAFHVEDGILEQQLDLALSGGHPFVTLP